MPKKKPEIRSLYFITHIDNLPSIFKHGILSHKSIEERSIPYTPIYDKSIVAKRKDRTVPTGQSLWEFANLYFQVRNPMLYRVVHEKSAKDLAVLSVQKGVLNGLGVFVATGNAASSATEILPAGEGLRSITEIWNTIQSEWWNSVDGSKRKIMAECLVPDVVRPDLIDTIYVASHEVAAKIKGMRLPSRISIVPEPNMFFRPARQIPMSRNLTLIEGDMFFSTMQTLTVSVNVVGVMGKGLASRAKYQFPDVYVIYQDACRRKQLEMGKPYLYKRESFVDEELADEPESLPKPNARKWFLLFATKRHWRDEADLGAIEAGLRWIRDSYKKKGIQSLAMPALGCGLGKLEWRDVGPVMCRYLTSLDIQIVIYLPRERQIEEQFLSATYLLAGKATE